MADYAKAGLLSSLTRVSYCQVGFRRNQCALKQRKRLHGRVRQSGVIFQIASDHDQAAFVVALRVG